MRSVVVCICVLLLLGLAAGIAAAKDAAPAAADPALEAHVRRIGAELRCLVCQNQTLAESDAGLAQDLREQMRVLLRQGADDAQVRRYMTERYGDFVLYRPPLKAATVVLWLGPAALLAGGLAALALLLRRHSRLADAEFEPDDFDARDLDVVDVEPDDHDAEGAEIDTVEFEAVLAHRVARPAGVPT
jgi:cytochrome c-type biogenesis protein CcmH